MVCEQAQARTVRAALFVVVVCTVGAVTSGAVKIVEGDSIHELAAHGEVKGVLRLLEADPSQLNKRGLQQRTPLMHSVLSGQTAVVKALLEAGADASIPEKDGYTPVHGAAFQGRHDVMEVLIAAGLDPSNRHKDGYTPLHRACWGNDPRHTRTVRVLLDAGVLPEEPTADGQTPIMLTQNRATRALLQERQSKQQAADGEL